MKKITGYFLLFSLPFLASCQSDKLEDFQWLAGNWQHTDGNTTTYEIWEKTNDSLFSGKSFVLKGSDTAFTEYLLLEQIGDNIYYTPTVKGQNNDKPVHFKLLRPTSGDSYIFENKEHDFPQRIIYTHPEPDSIFAYIEGNDKGTYRKEDYPMSRKKKI